MMNKCLIQRDSLNSSMISTDNIVESDSHKNNRSAKSPGDNLKTNEVSGLLDSDDTERIVDREQSLSVEYSVRQGDDSAELLSSYTRSHHKNT